MVIAVLLAWPGEGATRRLIAGISWPLADAVDQLATRHGWRICYEETMLRYAWDFHGEGPRLCVISMDYDPAQGPEAVLKQLVAEYDRRGCAGRYRVARQGRYWLVTVRQIRDEQGRWVDARSPLDYPVRMTKRGWFATGLNEMAWQLREQAGFPVGVDGGAAKGMLGRMVPSQSVYSGRMTARSVLMSLTYPPGENLWGRIGTDWRLTCAGKQFGCSLRLVRFAPASYLPPPRGPFLPTLPHIPRPTPAIR